MANVFISHRKVDVSDAKRLAEAVSAAGHVVWFDEWEIGIGDSVVQRIDSGLEELRCRLEDAGIETHDTDEIVGRPRFFCRDPFGNRVELTEWQGA